MSNATFFSDKLSGANAAGRGRIPTLNRLVWKHQHREARTAKASRLDNWCRGCGHLGCGHHRYGHARRAEATWTRRRRRDGTQRQDRPNFSVLKMFDVNTGWAVAEETVSSEVLLRTEHGPTTWQDVTPTVVRRQGGLLRVGVFDHSHAWLYK